MSNIIDKIQLSGVTYDIGGQGGSGVSVVEVTQAEYDALPASAKTDTSKMYVITDAEAGDLTNYYTKTETDTLLSGKADTATTYTKTEVDTLLGGKADTATTYTKTEVDNAITAATSTKQDTLVSGTNIKTINNISILGSGNIDIQGGGGGGKAIEAGRGIAITTGETADTISFDLPISAGTGTNSIREGDMTTASGNYSHAEGYYSKAQAEASHAEGYSTARDNYCHSEGYATIAYGFRSHAEGAESVASGDTSHAEGKDTRTSNYAEHASGAFNVSSSASTTFGDSGNTLFSVGNGTSNNARHNAFEIRQNGDIYLSSGGTDIKLQDHLGGGGGGGVTIDPTLDSGSTNPVANSAITEAVLVPSYRQLTKVEDNVQFANATALYVENVTGGSYINQCYYQVYLTGNSQVDEMIIVDSFSGHSLSSEPSYVDYEWTEDNSLILTPKTSGNYFYKVWYVWHTGFGVYTINDYPSGSSSSVIQSIIYPKLFTLEGKTDKTIVSGYHSYTYSDLGGYWYNDIRLVANTGDWVVVSEKLRYNDFGYDSSSDTIYVKKTTGATSGSTDCITSGGVYEQMGGMKIVKLTQSAYDALSPNYDSNTLYVIVN